MSESGIFKAAVKLPPDQRAAYLDAACGANTELRRELESLLQAYDAPESFLRDPPARPQATADYEPLTERPGTLIGPYKLMEQLGEGGMGLVFVAEQQEPVRRKVALKVIKPGMDTRDVIARFEAERQALALMDHPNIAKVLDAGATDSGRPYFVMELVKGMPITDYCDQNQLSPRERLELFGHVCQAVQHAHTKGVIHRDIKPSNVLVTLHDGTPVVKVIDFGVAKAIGQQLTEKTIYTRFAQLIGTPLYMSPEQAEMSGLDIDTRSDVYSLGVLLYELLTGTTPFDSERLKKAALDEVRRIIREEEPLRPSTRLSTLGQTLSAVSARRKTEPRQLSALVRGDLDWIVMKALDKDRRRRYETASALAQDVRRFLSEEPVEARPPSAWYRFRKLARRNKVALTTTAAVAVALVLGTAVSTWQAIRATRAEHIAWDQRDQALTAQREAEEARQGEAREKAIAQEMALAQARATRDAAHALQEANRQRDRAVQAEKEATEAAQKARAAEAEARTERDRARDALLGMFRLGVSFQRVGQDEQALAVFLKALEASQRAGKWSEGPSLIAVGAFDFKRRGKVMEAERLLDHLVQLHEEWREPAQAAAYRKELESVRQLAKPVPSGAVDVLELPKGTFTLKGTDGTAWALQLDGRNKFAVLRGGKVSVEGTYKITKQEIAFTDEQGPLAEVGAGKTGSYKWELANGKLTFTRLADAGGRSLILTSGSWHKEE